MTEIWSVWDQKGSEPIHFAERKAAEKFCDCWIKAALGKHPDVRKTETNPELCGGEVLRYFVGPLPLFTVRKSPLYESASEAPARKDYPRVSF